MKNNKNVLLLLTQIQDALQNNQGMTVEQYEQVRVKLDHAIAELQTKGISKERIFWLITEFLKVLPSVIDVINKHWT